MSALDLPLPRLAAETGAEAAFAGALAEALRQLHAAGGGDAAHGELLALAARRVAGAILAGETSVALEALEREAPGLEAALRASPVVAAAAATAPLVLDRGRLQLARYWQYENELAQRLAARNRALAGVDRARLRAELDRHFDGDGAAAPNWQKVAAATAVLRQLCVISGGPGTGKTTTVVRILAILLTLQPTLRIAIAAPTGKAAARVQESIRLQLQKLGLPAAIAAAMPREPHTLHRLLGYQPGRTTFRHDARHRLPYDVVVVDEASMLDLALAAKLAVALRDDARLILLGDKDQLASVEAGSVYAGLSAARAISRPWRAELEQVCGQSLGVPDGADDAPLPDAVVWLEHSYRFGAGSALGRLARAINGGRVAEAQALLAAGDTALRWQAQLPPPAALVESLMPRFEPYLDAVRRKAPPAEVFAAFEHFRVLCSTREGPYGAARLGELLTEALRRRLGAGQRGWFIGRPVLVTANDYALRLFNGDIGIVLPDARDTPLLHFPQADGSTRTLPPGRLGIVQDALAITVHRAQGSEFADVAVVIEPTVLRGLDRALLYTAVTRARRGIELYATETALAALG